MASRQPCKQWLHISQPSQHDTKPHYTMPDGVGQIHQEWCARRRTAGAAPPATLDSAATAAAAAAAAAAAVGGESFPLGFIYPSATFPSRAAPLLATHVEGSLRAGAPLSEAEVLSVNMVRARARQQLAALGELQQAQDRWGLRRSAQRSLL
jgi:hypothetical protein